MSDSEGDQPVVGTLAILGLGLLGGSIGLAAKQFGAARRVVGWSQREETRLGAIERGAIDESHPEPNGAVAQADLTIVCTPVGVMPAVFESIAGAVRAGAIVTDVGSTKRTIVSAGEKFIAPRGRFVGSHPMAGSDKQGIEAANAHLFQKSVCIITPTEFSDIHAVNTTEQFWTRLGSRLTRLAPSEHDRLLADVSHMPHLLAAALMNMQDERATAVSGNGFRDSTRIAGGDAKLWRDIFMDNRDPIIRSLDRLMAGLKDYRTALQAGDAGKIETLLALAATRRRKL